jgi:AsmA protein
MNKPVKYTLLGLAGLLVLVIAAVAIFAATFDPNKYKGEIERLAKEKTGRTLAIKGDIKLAFWPSLGADVAGVSLTEKGSNEVFAAFDSVHASVKLMPLLHGAYQVDAVKLTGAKARIVKLKNGKYNFSDLTEGGTADKQPEARKAPEPSSGKPVEFDISSVDIERASIQYIDQVAGQEYAIEDFRLKTGRIAEDAKGKLELAMVAKRKAPALTVKLSADGSYALKDGVLSGDVTAKLDDSTIKAKFTAAEPYHFDASIDKLNVDRYLGEPAKPQAQAQAPAQKSDEKNSEDAPVDLSGLKGLNAKGKLTIGELQVRGLKVAEVNAQLNAEKGRVAIAPHSAKLYEGTVSGEVVADANRNAISLKEQLKGIAIGPLLRDVAQRDQLEGKGDITLDVTAAGRTVSAMKKSLSGTAKVHLADGAIKGINLAEIIDKGRSLLGHSSGNSASAGESANDKTRRTDFSELAASFQIKNGVAHNEDLDVKAPLFRIGGNGNIDIGESKLDYTAKASVVATSKGQGGKEREQLAGLTVPVRLVGPLDDLKYQVDYRAMASNAVKSEAGQKLKERLGEELKSDKIQEKLKGLLGR